LLMQKGSLVRYRVYFRFNPDVEVESLVQRIAPELRRLQLRADTVSRRTEAISASIENLSRYLRLAVFVSVLLAGVGVASGVHVYTKQKISSVAVLRCIGAAPTETVLVFLAQVLLTALAGSLIGAVLGALFQFVLPIALKDFLPVWTGLSVAPSGIGAGMAIGLGTAVLFSLIPLVPLRNISPLLALRSSHETTGARRDPLLWSIAFLITAAVSGFAVATTGSWFYGFCFTAGVLMVFGFLVSVARGISALISKLGPTVLSFSWRQGLGNLHRPSNQTTAVMLAIGLGTFLMVTLYNVQTMLLNQVLERTGRGEPDLVLFDVQKHQREPLRALFRSFAIDLDGEVPIVTMRLAGIKHQTIAEVRADPALKIPDWVLRREYRSTYRSRLTASERIVSGTWQGKIDAGSEVIPISVEKSIAETLHVTLGDPLQFELQGVPLLTRVASIREVDWQRLEPNFFVVFPEGVLEEAPQFYAMVARTESNRLSANVQRAVVERFPNVSVIDLTLVIDTLEAILGRVSDAIRFVALFIVVTGLAVLASAILSSRQQRLKESILLRTLGAPRRQIVGAIVAEYFLLAAISSMTGSLLAVLASWGLSFYFFKTAAAISPGPIMAILILATAATVLAGVVGCWGIFRRSALEALRAET
ncbi:MAG TPA: FtsX-like permease family protein, partial [Candidatus Binatia bacterium]|nr:FtsX-like permease family protein [Candidatus Binatia bacterium]